MIIVTGGAGFIGSTLVWKLNELGYRDILIVDDFGSGQKWKNLVKRDIDNVISVDSFLPWLSSGAQHKIDAIFHMGACSSTTERDMDYLFRNNVHYSMEIFRYCRDHKIPFIYASSAATYGNGEVGYSDEISLIPSLRPINQYGYSKNQFDRWVLSQTTSPSFWAGLKFFNVYGPQEFHKADQMSLVTKAVPQIQETSQLKLFKSYKPGVGHGDQSRDFVYVKDVVDVLIHLFRFQDQAASGIYNVGTGKARSFADLGRAVFTALEQEPKFEWVEMPLAIRDQYQYFTEATLTNLREKAGYTKEFSSLEAGVSDYVKSHLLQQDQYL